MIDNQFDNFVNGKLKDHSAPVPAGLWNKVADGQFDNFISDKLKDHQAPVPPDLWGKITDTQFDGFVSNKLIDHVLPVPAGLWHKIHPEEKDGRKGFIFFRNPGMGVLMLALLMAGTLGGYLYFTDNTTKTNSNSVSLPKNTDKQQIEIVPGSSHSDGQPAAVAAPATNNDQPIDQPASSKELLPIAAKSKPQEADGYLPNNTALNNRPEDQLLSSLRKVNPAASANKILTPSPGNNWAGLTLAPIELKPTNGLRVYKEDIQNSDHIRTSNTTKSNLNRPDNNNANSSGKSETGDPIFEFIEPYHTKLFTAVTIPSGTNQYTGLLKLSDKQLIAGNHTSRFKNVIICPSDRKNRNTDWHLEVYTSPDMAFRSLSNVSAAQPYLLRKDSSESMQVGYTAGLRLVKPITDNIILKAGVQYSQMNEKFVYRTENEVKTTTVVTVRTIVRAPGDTVIISDTSVLTQIGFKNNTVKNRYRSFDIPVTIGYQFGNEDLKFGINAGIIFNVSSWYQGVILDSSLTTVPLTKSNNMVYKSNIGLGLYAGVSIIKRLSDDLHLFAEPYFRYNLSNMTTPQSSYNQKFSLGGVSLGLRFNLNRQ